MFTKLGHEQISRIQSTNTTNACWILSLSPIPRQSIALSIPHYVTLLKFKSISYIVGDIVLQKPKQFNSQCWEDFIWPNHFYIVLENL